MFKNAESTWDIIVIPPGWWWCHHTLVRVPWPHEPELGTAQTSGALVLQFTAPRTPQRMFKNVGHWLESSRTGEATSGSNRGAAVEADASGRNQGAADKRTQSGSSSRSGCNRGAAAEAHAIRELLKSGKSSWSGRKQRAAAEADAIGEQQLCTESYPAPDYSRRQMRGSSWASEASKATCIYEYCKQREWVLVCRLSIPLNFYKKSNDESMNLLSMLLLSSVCGIVPARLSARDLVSQREIRRKAWEYLHMKRCLHDITSTRKVMMPWNTRHLHRCHRVSWGTQKMCLTDMS